MSKHRYLEPCLLWILFLPSLVYTLSTKRPNVVIFYADDLGYGDIEPYGHPTSSTPNLRRLAADGLVLTQFYSAAAVCSPSRAALLTGRYQMRSGIYPGVFNVKMSGGLPLNEVTIAEMLKPEGYRSAAIGKWHLGLGNNSMYLPPSHGFDVSLGLPASPAQCRCSICFYPNVTCHSAPCAANEYTPCALFNGTKIVEQPVDLLTLDEKYVAEGRHFIRENVKSETPFFLYYASHHTHQPQYAGKETSGTSLRGRFGDSLAALDWEVGQIYQELEENGILDDTFFFFSADNGPALYLKTFGGNAGLMKCGKGTTYEGGMRVPAIIHWPGRITPGRSFEFSSTLDILPTIASITKAKLPAVTLDGYDMSPFLFDGMHSIRESFFYYPPTVSTKYKSFAVRYRQYKVVFYTEGSYLSNNKNKDVDCRESAKLTYHDPPMLFDLEQDPSENYNLSVKLSPEKDIVQKVTEMRTDFDARMVFAESQMRRPKDDNLMPCCNRGCIPFPTCCHCTGNTHREGRWATLYPV
ncbi:arylsulfatase A-like [Lytechinus variegatus]|uniref:arylsulfatase A-like n=1 Tax=Lytechinus variegatus TaxID=7654 RepID=UPI001BB27C37|nr:arylsulfatase A-like [Lytechinus variegatus]